MKIKIAAIFMLMAINYSALAQSTVLFIGDSLTAGYGVKKEKSYPSLIQDQLNSNHKIEAKIINGSISGSTSASALSRLRWYLKSKPNILLLALGANDGLRGLDIAATKKNLEDTILLAKEHKVQVILIGMQMPPNYGKEYTQSFKRMYDQLIQEHQLKSVPFLLEKVAGEKDFNQEDGIHPNEKGHEQMAKNVMPALLKALKDSK